MRLVNKRANSDCMSWTGLAGGIAGATEGGRLNDGGALGVGTAAGALGNRADGLAGCDAAGVPNPAKTGGVDDTGDEGFDCAGAGDAEKMPPPGGVNVGGFAMPNNPPGGGAFCPNSEV